MKWYDLFANIYDKSLDKLYAQSRKRAVDLLDLKTNETLIDIACGTGANFKYIKERPINLTIYGTDFSEGMLKKAKNTVEKNKWNNIILFQSDAKELTPIFIKTQMNKEVCFDKIICFLGLSVIPEWELALDNMLNLLKENGKIVIVDVFAEKRNFNTWLVEKFAKADLNRKIAQTLEKKTSNFYHEFLPIKESKVGGKIFVATGLKKTIPILNKT